MADVPEPTALDLGRILALDYDWTIRCPKTKEAEIAGVAIRRAVAAEARAARLAGLLRKLTEMTHGYINLIGGAGLRLSPEDAVCATVLLAEIDAELKEAP